MTPSLQPLFATRPRRIALGAVILIALLVLAYRVGYPLLFQAYVGEAHGTLTYANSKTLTDAEFATLADDLTREQRERRAAAIVSPDQDPFARRIKIEMLMNTESFRHQTRYPHIAYFRDAGIRRYEGPVTCLGCHPSFKLSHPDGTIRAVDTLTDVLDSVHFKFQSDARGFSTVGFDGREVNGPGERRLPMGKINRACGIPGSFSWTGWAALVDSRPEGAKGALVPRSEGCGQCHIGGDYYPATERMMPVGDVTAQAKAGLDCLICHAAEYDMNQRYVIRDAVGLRWNQDRSLRAALTVGRSSDRACLRCHQHNLGGDSYAHNEAAQALGEQNPRLLHGGSKRGNAFSPSADVHARAGLACTDCHVPQGHKIPRGRKGVDLIANDLPDREVSCETCHSRAPHNRSPNKALLNGHIARLACETCHIHALEDSNVVLRDWVHPTWDPEAGIFEPTDLYRSGAVGKGFTFLWFNGKGTFLANALGSNPNGGDYDPLMRQLAQITDPEIIAAVREQAVKLKERYPDIEVDAYVRAATDPLSQLSPESLEQRRAMIRDKLRPAMEDGESRIYPFKLFNAMMFEDMGNQGPFGAMILPFDYQRYYETGDSQAAVEVALANPIVERMYQKPFKRYMMDDFMAYFGVSGGWRAETPLVKGGLRQVEPRWMRQMGSLMLNHGIQPVGRACQDCHAPNGILNYALLGYLPERAAELENLDLIDPPGAVAQ